MSVDQHMFMFVCASCLQQEEELGRLQAELHSLLAGVTATRHEQQQQQRLIAQLRHQHEDSMQVATLLRISSTATLVVK